MHKNFDKLVSIIIPVYNAEKYLRECLESILNQTYRNLEIICVDDGSTDNSAEIITEYQINDSRIRLIRQQNQYAGVARNNGVDVSSGEYVMFLDADDFFELELVEKMVNKISEHSADIAICRCYGLNEQTGENFELAGALNMALLPKDKDCFSPEELSDCIFQLTAGWAWDRIYRSDFIRKNDLKFQSTRVANDLRFVFLSSALAEKIAILDEHFIIHRMNVNGSLEYSKNKHWMCAFEALVDLKNKLIEHDVYSIYERSYINRAASYLVWYAYTIYEPDIFSEFYTFLQKQSHDEFGFGKYSKEFFDDEWVYEQIIQVINCSPMQFLMHRIKEHENTINIQQNIIANLEAHRDLLARVKKWTLPEGSIPEGKKIAVYGYGDIGRDLCEDIRKSEKVEIAAVVDRNYKNYEGTAETVKPVEVLSDVVYDYVLIAVYNEETAKSIAQDLTRYGVTEDKTIWIDFTK